MDEINLNDALRYIFGPPRELTEGITAYGEPPQAELEYIELRGGACDACVQAIANDDYSGMSDEEEAQVRAGLARVGEWLIVGDELGFCHDRCAVCGSFPGDRHEVGYLREVSR